MFLYDLGSLAPSDVQKCAKSVVLPTSYMSSTDANYLPGYGASSKSESKTNWVPIAVGAAVVAGVVWWATSSVGRLPPMSNPGLAKKRGVTARDVDPEQLRIGTEHELEHTDDVRVARQIALDHLAEMPDYYTRLATIEPSANPREKKDTRDMTAGEINRELDSLDKKRSKLNDEFIAAGRGHETVNETWKKDDPLALRYKEISNRHGDLRNEISARMGPGAPSRLPKGRFFGPRKVIG